jgi:hypothetical protein
MYMYRVGDSGFVVSNGNPSFTDVNSVVADSFAGGVSGDEILVYAIVTRGGVTAKDSASVTISPREITVKPIDKSKVYDGSPLIPDQIEISSGALVEGHSLETSSAIFNGSQTEAGVSASSVSGVSVAGTNPDNYAISYAPGMLTVTEPPPPKDEDGNGKKDSKDGDGRAPNDSGGNGGGTYPPASEANDSDDSDDSDGGTGNVAGGEDSGATTDVDPGGKDIDNVPTPTTGTGEGDRGGDDVNSWLSRWWPLIVAVAAIIMGVVIAIWNKRRKENEDIVD